MKKRPTPRIRFGALWIFFLVGRTLAEEIPNWVPPTYPTPGQIRKLADATGPRAFIGLPPCRIVDTRGNGAPIQGGMLTGGADVRTYDVDGICGIPTGVDALSLNFTAVGPAAAGFLVAWPAGGTVPSTSILNYVAGQTVANAAIVPVDLTGAFIVNSSAATHLLVDINGYFSDVLGSPNNSFRIDNNSTSPSISATNASTSCQGPCGIRADISSTSGAHAIAGFANGATGTNYGVLGDSESSSADAAGILANSDAATGQVYGLLADNDSIADYSAGVRGRSGTNSPPSVLLGTYGVIGHSFDSGAAFNIGVGGQGQGGTAYGVFGIRYAGGALASSGVLGGPGNNGVYSFQDVGAAGLKPFIVPYDGIPTKQIMFVAAEGDEALVFTRGRIKVERGFATIRVRDHFLKVAEAEGWSVQLTPIGEMATLAVLRIDPDRGEILVKASRNVEAFYRIEAVRRGYANFQPVQENELFVPASADTPMEPWPAKTKEILIRNGIYKADGMPNLDTAERLGWIARWEKQASEAKALRAAVRAKEGHESRGKK